MKTVFTNSMLAHVWAQQTQEHGRSNSMNFQGDTLYSYGTPIARIIPRRRGKGRVMLISSHGYSTTTAMHKNLAWQAWSTGMGESFHVPSLGRSGGRHRELDSQIYPATVGVRHRANLKHLVDAYKSECARFKRALSRDWNNLENFAASANAYARAFDFKVAIPDWRADEAKSLAFRTEREARLSTPEHAAKREKARLAREALAIRKVELARLASAERITKWREGEPVSLNYSEARIGQSAMLRLRRDSATVETSLGATVPLEDAKRAYAAVLNVMAHGTDWHRNGSSLQVGQFQIDRISASGDVHAGCHYFTYAEVRAFFGGLDK